MIKTIIIDDEADGRETLLLLIREYCPEIEISALCSTADEGNGMIHKHQPDLVFLDIQMPHKSGFNLLEELGGFDFEVIFVTAHDRYAIKAIKFSALDYLLKPVDVDELQKAVRKAKERIGQKGLRNNYESLLKNMKHPAGRLEKLAIPAFDGIIFEKVDDIIYCKADGNYTNLIFTGKRNLLVSKNLKDFDGLLSECGFFRVHHASLINMKHIKKYVKGEGGYVILEEGHHVDVSRRKKEQFLGLLNKVGN
jgi:two-component system, LytTR family, response regulator